MQLCSVVTNVWIQTGMNRIAIFLFNVLNFFEKQQMVSAYDTILTVENVTKKSSKKERNALLKYLNETKWKEVKNKDIDKMKTFTMGYSYYKTNIGGVIFTERPFTCPEGFYSV